MFSISCLLISDFCLLLSMVRCVHTVFPDIDYWAKDFSPLQSYLLFSLFSFLISDFKLQTFYPVKCCFAARYADLTGQAYNSALLTL
jgi:hypothetical protein